MLRLTGAAIILITCFLYGNMLTRKAEAKVHLTEALCSFVMYINTSIKTARVPLNSIFYSFKNDALEDAGFSERLCCEGLLSAINHIESAIPREVFDAMIYLEKNIGGIDIESQTGICAYVEESLKEELKKAKNNFNNKKRMYRMLPVLAGLSVIILIV